MTTLFTKATLALALGASALAVATPAQAQRYGGDYRGRDNGTAVVAGIAGLAVGAALASDRGRGGYYEEPGYGYGYGYGAPVVYEQPYYRGYRPAYDGYYRDYGRGRGYDGRGYYRGHGHDHGRDGYRR